MVNEPILSLKSPNEQESIILLVYRYGSRKLVMSTGLKVKSSSFNKAKQQIRESLSTPEYHTYNKILISHKSACRKAIQFFISRDDTPTVPQLKDKILEYLNPESSQSKTWPNKVLPYMDKFILEAKELKTMKIVSVRAYFQVRNRFKDFSGNSSYEFKDIDLNLLKRFTKSMIDKNYSSSYIHKVHKQLISILNHAVNHQIEVPNDYTKTSLWKVGKPNNAGNNAFLSPDEIEILENLNLPSRLETNRDRFLIGLYTGQRYSDYSKLTINNIVKHGDQKFLEFVQMKTNKKISIPLSSSIERILIKYDGYPPTISSQKFNKNIQEVCKIAGFNDNVIIHHEKPNQNTTTELLPKWQVITSHTARRSWATNAHNKGVPLTTIMHYTGHSSISSLQSYLKIDLNNLNLAQNLKLFG